MDLETIYFEKAKSEIPIAISSCGYFKEKLENKVFLIDHYLLMKDHELALKKLWQQYFNYLENVINNEITIQDKLTIFAHNLGEFDGYFLYKGLLNHFNPDLVTSIIDEANSFISIQHKMHPIIEWKDSLRVFPMSLNKLCKMFSVIGKTFEYNPKFRNLNMFNNPRLLNSFKKYALQDAKALYDALFGAQLIYWSNFHVDIQSVYSTATLSLKIYRTKFQDQKIFILPPHLDNFVRDAYFGGGTDVYKAYGENIHHYDVNSLYPYAMLNPMPYDLVNNKKINLKHRKLDTFFGFCLVNIFCPIDMARPVLPFHKDGKTIYPVGTWTGTYFSEELKAVQKLGYQITLIEGYEFTKADLFSPFVKHFYEIKKK